MFECVDVCVCVRTSVRVCAGVQSLRLINEHDSTAKRRAVAAIGGHTFGK